MGPTKKWAGIAHQRGNSGHINPNTDIRTYLEDTGQSNLPQSQVLVEVLSHLVEHEHIEEAYLRGSFSYGEADEHSDIDLFTVVEPEKLEETYNSLVSYLEQNYPITVLCHDKLVADYGGVGFMFICEDENGRPFQLDVYFALKGIAPKSPLVSAPRIYARDPEYRWTDDKLRSNDNSIPEATRRFIKSFTDNDSDQAQAANIRDELMVTLFVMNKHIKRGQRARTISDHSAAFNSCVDLFKLCVGDETHQSSTYHADRMIARYRNSDDPVLKDAANILSHIIDSTNDTDKIKHYFRFQEILINKYYPDLQVSSEPKMAKLKKMLCTPPSDDGIKPTI